MHQRTLVPLVLLTFMSSAAWAAGFAASCRVTDTPNDGGGSLTVSWAPAVEVSGVEQYEIWLARSNDGPFSLAKVVAASAQGAPGKIEATPGKSGGAGRYRVDVTAFTSEDGEVERLQSNSRYYVRVDAVAAGERALRTGIVAAVPVGNLFNRTKVNNLILALAFSVIILFTIRLARTRDLYIRPIAGLEAMNEALGRATEMGKAVLFVHGLRDMSYISTIAAVNILGRVARRTADMGTLLQVTNSDPVVMLVSQETVKEAYLEAGRPDAYNPDDIFIAGTDQFSYAAAVEGIMVRERPAAHIMMGYFYAEALLLAETGSTTGAIQIAGTDAFTQLPFFVTTCDYTLMGEELYAASAYLSREPKLLGSLKGQDAGKLILIIVILLGAVFSSLGFPQLASFFSVH